VRGSVLNRGLLWGQLLTGLETARHALAMARRGEHFLSDDDMRLLRETVQVVGALEQRAWAEQQEDARWKRKTKPRKRP
jgi:hypothetical protein